MNFKKRAALALLALFSTAGLAVCATFGTSVAVRGTVSDLALDNDRGRLYIANFSAGRIEVMDTSSRTLQSPLLVSSPPSAVALSPGGGYLVVGEYNNFDSAASKGGLTIFNLNAATKQDVALDNPVLSVAFGAGSQALVITTKDFLLLDPSSGNTTPLPAPVALDGKPLPVPFSTFPPEIVEASTGVSGDGQKIVILAQIAGGNKQEAAVLLYRVGELQVGVIEITSTPPLGPRSVSVNQDGSKFMVGWTLMSQNAIGLADIPYATGDFRLGGHVWDTARNRIYVDAPVSAGEAPVLHLMDTDNLTVTQRIQLPQTMSGRAIMSRDGSTAYAASVGGVLVLPIDTLYGNAPRVAAMKPEDGTPQEDVVFLGDSCNRQIISHFVDIVNQGVGSVDFKLSLPNGTKGVQLSLTSGVTFAHVRIDVDPTLFQNAKGSTTIPLTITSAKAINIPFPVRLVINTRDVNQTGKLVNVPGKIVDILADPARNFVYLLRQDTNLVLVYDRTTLKPVMCGDNPCQLRTGNTPVSMAITDDQRYLIVGNDHSHLASVFDLDNNFEATPPIIFQDGYPRSIAVSHGGIWAVVRVVSPPDDVTCSGTPITNPLYRIDFDNRKVKAPPTLGVYCNQVPADSVLAATPSSNYMLLAMSNGTAAMWDGGSDTWLVSRNNGTAAGGAFGAFDDQQFVVDNKVLDPGLFPIATLESTSGRSSGVGVLIDPNTGLRTTNAGDAAPGTIERVNLDTLETYSARLTAEAPVLVSTLTTTPIGQIGQTILPFTRTLAVSQDGGSFLLLTQSGLTVIAPNFDAPTPLPMVTGLVNAADGGADVAPGGLALVQGNGLALRSEMAISLPLPSTLGDACVTVGNIALPLFRVSPTEILAQLPFGLSGDVALVVRSPGGISDPFNAHIQAFAPAIFRTGQAGDETGLATVIRQKNDDFVNFTNPIHPDDVLSIYLTGLSQTSPAAPFGDAAPLDPLAVTTTVPTVTLGNSALSVLFSGLVPGEVGVYIINVSVPHGVPGAVQTPLTVKQGGFSTTLQVRVVNP